MNFGHVAGIQKQVSRIVEGTAWADERDKDAVSDVFDAIVRCRRQYL